MLVGLSHTPSGGTGMAQCHPLAREGSRYDWKQQPRKQVNAHVTPRTSATSSGIAPRFCR